MFRFLLLAGLVGGAYYLLTRSKKGSQETETMIECKKCGTFVSSEEAIKKGKDYYCSPECLKGS
ncbi:MAG: hypothetical protein GXO61_03790 [Epsilonproteobacteria bacterium]|nr:hypothetical protein [Campylobacterota bacterium]